MENRLREPCHDCIDERLLTARLLNARSELGRAIADPMWPAHAEVSKTALKRWHKTIDAAIKAGASANGAMGEREVFEAAFEKHDYHFRMNGEERNKYDFEAGWKARASLTAEKVAGDAWKIAIDNELVTIGSTADSFGSAREAVDALINWHVAPPQPAQPTQAATLSDEQVCSRVRQIQELMLKWINSREGWPAKRMWDEIERELRAVIAG